MGQVFLECEKLQELRYLEKKPHQQLISGGFSILVELELGDDSFSGGRKTWRSQRKTFRARRDPITLNPHIAPGQNDGNHAVVTRHCAIPSLTLVSLLNSIQSHAREAMCMQLVFMPRDKDRYYTFTVRFLALYRL